MKHAEIFSRLAPHAWKGYPKIRGEITIPHTSPTLITGENANCNYIYCSSRVEETREKLRLIYHVSEARATKSCETGYVTNYHADLVQGHCSIEIV